MFPRDAAPDFDPAGVPTDLVLVGFSGCLSCVDVVGSLECRYILCVVMLDSWVASFKDFMGYNLVDSLISWNSTGVHLVIFVVSLGLLCMKLTISLECLFIAGMFCIL